MQNAKDSFYIALRDRLAILNPLRIVMLRGVQRPGIVVEEAEVAMGVMPNDIFVLRWVESTGFYNLPVELRSAQCELHYSTCGSQTNAGLDRGRDLAAMDKEVLGILHPLVTQTMRFTATGSFPIKTNVFWTEPVLGPVVTLRDKLSRFAKVNVFALEGAKQI